MIKLMNTTILPNPGSYRLNFMDAEAARAMIAAYGYESYIGHDAAAQAMGLLLDVDVPVNRAMAQFDIGDVAICLKLKGRLPEGQVLDLKGMEEVGYDLFLLERVG